MQVAAGRLKDPDKIGVKVGKVINKRKVGKHFILGSTVKRGFWAVDGMMVQVGGLRLAADSVTA